MTPFPLRVLFFFNDTATTEIYTLSLHDALPIFHEWITVDSPKPPPIVLNKHCPLCPFQHMCQTQAEQEDNLDRKSTRLNSSHLVISYAVFCLKKKTSTGAGRPSSGGGRGRVLTT